MSSPKGPAQNSSQLNAPAIRPQAKCVFACLPANTNMHPGMNTKQASKAEVESASLAALLPGRKDASRKVREESSHSTKSQRRAK